MSIDDALRAIAQRGECDLDDLPEGVGLDELRILDSKGYLHVKVWGRVNTSKLPGENSWAWDSLGWKSPIHDPGTRDWDRVWGQGRQRTEWTRPHQVKLNDSGLAAMAMLGPPQQPSQSCKPDGWTKAELVSQIKAALGSWSGGTFDAIRNDTGIAAPPRGGKGQQHKYGTADLRKLILAVEKGRRRNKAEIARAWRELLGE